MGDFLMLDDNGPLLYINTVKSDAKANNQDNYDSRITDKNTLYRKLGNIVSMYKRDKPVLCRLVTKSRDFMAIPVQLDKNILTFNTQEGKSDKIDITLLSKVEIIKF